MNYKGGLVAGIMRMIGMATLKVRVRRYKAEELVVGGVVIGVLRLEVEKQAEATGNSLDVLLSVAEAEARGRGAGTDYYEVIVEGGEVRRVLGEGPRYTWGKRLAFKPERLLRVGIVRKGVLKPITSPPPEELAGGEEQAETASEGAYVFKLDDVEWYNVDENIYVYEGTLTFKDQEESDIVLVVLETESGRRYVRPSRVLRRSRSSRTQQ